MIARDRLGIKPLYYTRQGGRIQFASEIKALLEDPAVERKVNPNGLHHYLSYLYVPCPETMFEGIYKVPPGHTVVCTDGGERFTQYWDVSVREEPSMTLAEATEGLRAHLARSVDRRMMSDVPLGAYLSGGIDSSLIVALMAEASEEPVRTFTLGFGDEHEPFNEFRYAREVADAFSTDHHEFVAREEDVQQVLRDAVWHFDELFGDGLHTGFISKMAKDHVTVALTGLGSDELFGGYGRHGRARRANLYGALPGILRRPFEWGLDRLPENVRRRFPFDKVGRMASRAGLPDWAFYAGEIDLMPTAFRREAYSDAFTADFKTRDLSGFLRRSVEDAPLDASQDPLAYLETKTTMVEDFLNYVDRMGMAHSMELRVPFLDHELVEFAGSIPLRHKVRGLGDTKYVLKQDRGERPSPQDRAEKETALLHASGRMDPERPPRLRRRDPLRGEGRRPGILLSITRRRPARRSLPAKGRLRLADLGTACLPGLARSLCGDFRCLGRNCCSSIAPTRATPWAAERPL